jgi:hypothetical protein
VSGPIVPSALRVNTASRPATFVVATVALPASSSATPCAPRPITPVSVAPLGGVAPLPAATVVRAPILMTTTQSPLRFIASNGLATAPACSAARRIGVPNEPPAGRNDAKTPSESVAQSALAQL